MEAHALDLCDSPLTCWWDGLVSACRAYTVAEMLAMTQGFDDYKWKADRIGVRGNAGHLTYLLGIPRSSRIWASGRIVAYSIEG